MPGPDPAPIRGRWTIYHCPLCDWWEGDANLEGIPECNGWPVAASHALIRMESAEVVPVPDEAAIERGAEAAREAHGYDFTTWRDVALAVLRAALEPTDP